MKVEVYADADAVANTAAGLIATMRGMPRGRFVMAVSGGPTIPAGRVRQDRALVIADRAAAGK